MKIPLLYSLLGIIMMSLTSFKPADELKMDWSRVTDKEYILTYVKVVYDSSSQYAIDTKVRIYNTNDGARALSKNSVKLLKQLILDNSNFMEDNDEHGCSSNYFPYAIVATRNGEAAGIINIGCKERVLYFEPKCSFGELLVLNDKGIKLKEELFKNIK